MSELDLTPGQLRRLRKQLKHTSDARVYRRTLAVLEVARGTPVSQVAQTLAVTRQSVYNWVEAYCQGLDPTDLHDGQRSGRPHLFDEFSRAYLRSLLGQSPDHLGYAAVNWTVPLLLEQLRRCTAEEFSDSTLRRELDHLGYVWKRPRYVLDPDPEFVAKKDVSAGG
jgi:transposase